jgi:hypothetical protein
MKYFFYKNIFRAKYECNGKYFWNHKLAIEYATTLNHRTFVYAIKGKFLTGWRRVYTWSPHTNYRLHPDANNFSRY